MLWPLLYEAGQPQGHKMRSIKLKEFSNVSRYIDAKLAMSTISCSACFSNLAVKA